MSEIFKSHSDKQERALFTDKRVLVCGTGTQWGKTTIGALRMKMKMHTHTDRSDNFIITSPSYPIMSQSTLPPFLHLMDGYGTHDKKHNCFRMHDGGTCWFRTETDPDSIVGITNVRHIWGDEAGKYRLYFWQNIQARADFFGCGVDLTTSPYSLNWIFHELIKPHRDGKRPDLEVIQAASWENPYHSLNDPAKRNARMAEMDLRRFKMIYGGEFSKMEGLVYDCWDDDLNLINPCEIPTGSKIVGGLDWGYYPDPFVLKVRVITPAGLHLGVSEFVKTRLTINDQILVAKQKKEVFGIEIFYADPSQPGSIEEFNRNKLTCVGADNDIRKGLDLHYELVKSRRYREFKNACPHSSDERENYHYPEPKDLKPDEDQKDQLPVDQHNHCFPAGTLIETIHGAVPIEYIRPGTRVFTRSGTREVLDQWCEGEKDIINIGHLKCTPDHRIYTKNKSFVRADELTERDELATWKEWKKRSFFRAKHTNFTRARDILVVAPVASTLWFGSILTAPFRRAFMFTTRMETQQIIGLKTWNWLKERFTYLTTCWNASAIQMSSQSSAPTLKRSAERPLNGTPPLRVVLGTDLMLASFKLLRKLDLWRSGARNVVKRFIPFIFRRTAQNIAQAGARPLSAGRASVYNLTVQGDFEYFADGILVSNCMDVDRYITMMTYRSHHQRQPHVPEERAKIENRLQRTERLKRFKREPQTENWS